MSTLIYVQGGYYGNELGATGSQSTCAPFTWSRELCWPLVTDLSNRRLTRKNVSVEIHREAPNESFGRILENTLRSTARALAGALWLMLFWRGRVCDMMIARGLLALQLMAEQLGEGHSMTKLLLGFSPSRSVWRRIDDGR